MRTFPRPHRPSRKASAATPAFVKRLSSWLVLSTALALSAAQLTKAASIKWTGTTDADFETAGNWLGLNSPPTNDFLTDIGFFEGLPTANQPTLTVDRAINGLQFDTSGWTLGGAFTLNLGASGINNGAQTSGLNTISAKLSIGAAQTWQVGVGGTLAVSGEVSGSGGQLTIGSATNTGTVILSGVNTFTGTVAITGGTLQVSDSTGLGANTNDVTFGAAGTLRVTGTTATTNNQFFGAGTNVGTFQVDGVSVFTIAAGPSGVATNGLVSFGAGGFVKTGTGTLLLTGNNSFFDGTSGIRVDQGTLAVGPGSNAVLGDGGTAWDVRLNGGALSFDTDTNLGVFAGLRLEATNSTLVSNRATNGAGVTHVMSVRPFVVNAGGMTLNVQGGALVTSGTSGITLGATTLNGALTLNITDPVASGTNTVLTLGTITNGANTITVTGNGDFLQTGVLGGGAGGFTTDVGYTGIARLNQANTYTGITAVGGGTLQLFSSPTSIPGGLGVTGGTSNLTIFGGGVVDLGNTGNVLRNLGTAPSEVQFTGSGGFGAVAAARTVNFGGAGAQVTWGIGSFVPNGSVLVLSSATSDNSVTFVNPIDFNGATRTIQVNNGTFATDGIISGVLSNGALTKTGNGTLSLTATNTYTGTTTVNAGTLAMATNANLGPTPGAVNVDSIILDGGALGTTATFTLDANRGILVGSAVGTGTGTIDVASATTLTYGGVIADNGPQADNFTKTGAGTLLLTGISTYTGTTSVSQGTLRYVPGALADSSIVLSGGNVSYLHDGNGTSTPNDIVYGEDVTVTASSSLTVGRLGTTYAPLFATASNKTIQLGTLSISAQTLTVNNNDGYELEFTGTTTLTGAANFSVATATASNVVQGLTLGGSVTDGAGSFGITKSGLGTLVLASALNDFTGDIVITQGVVSIASDTGAGFTSMLGAPANKVVLNPSTGTTPTSTLRATEDITTARVIQFGNTANTRAIEVASGKTLTLTSPFDISVAASASLAKNEFGTLAIAVSNTGWTGASAINRGAVLVSNNTALGSGTITVANFGSALQLTGAVTVANPVTLNFNSALFGGINSGGLLQSVSGVNTYSGAVTQTSATAALIGAAAGATLNFTGTYSSPGSNSIAFTTGAGGTINWLIPMHSVGTNSVTKWGTGTFNLTVASPLYTAALNVNGGTFGINGTGSIAGTAAITLTSGSTLTVDDSSSSNSDRLSTRAVVISASALNYIGGGVAGPWTSSEVAGVLTAAAGLDTVQVTGGTLANPATLTFSSLASNVINVGGFLNLQGIDANNRVVFTTAPTLVGGVIQRAALNGTDLVTQTAGATPVSVATYTAVTGDINNSALAPGGPTATTANAELSSGTHRIVAPSTTVNSVVMHSGTAATLSGTAGSVITVTSGNILVSGSLGNVIGNTASPGNGIVLAQGTVPSAIMVNTGAALELAGTITTGANTGLQKALGGSLDITGKQFFTSGTGFFDINGGTVKLSAGDHTLAAGLVNIALDPSATLDLNGSVLTTNAFHSSGISANPDGGGDVINSSGSQATLIIKGAMTFGGQITGNTTVSLNANATTLLINDNTYTGGTLITAGTNVIRDYGKLSGATGNIDINYGQLHLYNDGFAADFNRLSDNKDITLRGGTIALKGRGGMFVTETVGDVTLALGTSSIGSTNSNANGAADTVLTLSSLGRTAANGATVGFTQQFYNVTGGGTTGGNTSDGTLGIIGNNGRIEVTGGIPLTNHIIGGWAVTTHFFDSATAEFATYIPGLGVAALATPIGIGSFTPTVGTAGYDGAAFPAANQPTQNIRLTAGGTVTSGGVIINALNLASNTTSAVGLNFAAAGNVLNLGSGGLIVQNVIASAGATTIGASGGNTGILTAGGNLPGAASDLYLYHFTRDGAALTINSQITDNPTDASAVRLVAWGGATSGASLNEANIILANNTNDYSGGTVVNQATLTIGATGNLPTGGLTINGGLVTQTAGGVIGTQAVTLNGSSTLTLVGDNTLTSLTFENVGGAGAPTVNAGGIMTLTAATPITLTSSNVTTVAAVTGGTLSLGAATKTFSVGAATVNGEVADPWKTDLNVVSTIADTGSGVGVIKTGAGNLQLTATGSTFDGGVNVMAGGLVIGASSTPSAVGTPTVTSGPLGTGTLTIGAGTTILSSAGANAVANATTISGNFTFGGLNNVALNGAISMPAAATTIEVSAPQTTDTLGGVITAGAGSIIKTGYGTLVLGNNNSFSGGVFVSNGTLVGHGVNGSVITPFGSASDIMINGGSLALRNNGVGNNLDIFVGSMGSPSNLVLNPTLAGFTIDINNNGANTNNTFVMGNLSMSSTTQFNVTGGNSYKLRFTTQTVTGATPTPFNPGTGLTIILPGGFTDANRPVNIGPGTMVLTGNNAFTTGTTITTSGQVAMPTVNNDPTNTTGGEAIYGEGQSLTFTGTGITYSITPQMSTLIAGTSIGGLEQTFTNVAGSLAVAASWGNGPGSVFNGVQPNDAGLDRVAYTNPGSGLVTYNGYITIGTGGTYSFIVGADDNSSLVIDGVEVARDIPGGHGLQDTARGSIVLSAGVHAITLKVNAGTGQAGGGSRLLYSGPDTVATGGNNGYQAIPSIALTYFTGPANAGNNFYNAAQIDNDYVVSASSSATLQGLGTDFNSTLKTLTMGAGSTLGATNDQGTAGAGGTGFIGVKGVANIDGAGVILSPTTANLYLIGGIDDDDGAAPGFGLTKTGVGTLSLNNSGVTGTFTGAFAINAGTVRIFEANALSTGGNTVASGASLDLNGTNSSAGRNVTINGVGTISQFGALYNSSAFLGTLAGNLTLGATAATIAGYGDMTVSGTVTGTTALTKTGPNTLTLSGGNAATLSSAINVAGGVLNNGALDTDGTAGAAGSLGTGAIAVNAGAALNLNGNNISQAITTNGTALTNSGPNRSTLGNIINSSFSASFANAFPAAAGSAQLKLANTASTATMSGNLIMTTGVLGIGSNTYGAGGDIIVTGVISGGQAIAKRGGDTVFLRGVNTYTGGTFVDFGTLELENGGIINATGGGAIAVQTGGSLIIDDVGTIVQNRLNSGVAVETLAANKALTLNGGTFTILGNATTAVEETTLVGATGNATGITIGQGHNYINLVNNGANVTLNTMGVGTGGAMLATNAGTVLITGKNLGSGVAAATNTNVLFSATGTSSVVGQAGTNGANTKGITPWAIVDNTLGGTGTATGVSFATLDSVAPTTIGLRPLAASEYATALTASTNVNVTAALTTAVNVNTSINSLTFATAAAGLTLQQGTTLNIQSGGILATQSNTIAGPGIISTDSASAGQNLYIHTYASGTTLTLNATIGFSGQNSGRLGEVVKAGAGTLILGGANFHTTNTRVQEGKLTLGNDLAIYYRQTMPASISNFNSSNAGPMLQINGSGIVDMNGFDLTVNNLNSINPAGVAGSLSGGTILNGVAGNKDLTINTTTNNTWSGNISSGTGAINFSKYGRSSDTNGAFFITNENTYTGTTVIGGGSTILVDVGALRGTSSVAINSAGLNWIDTGNQADAYRLGAAPADVIFNGGGFLYNGRAGAFTVANLGDVTLASGANQFTTNAALNGNATTQMATFTRSAGAVVNFAGSVLGDDGNVKVSGTAPTNFNGIIGGWAITSATNPYVATGLTGTGTGDFVEYDPATGFRAIVDYRTTAAIDYSSGTDRPASGNAAFGVNQNIRVNNNTTLAAGNNVANSMVLGTTATTTLTYAAPADTLFIQSGGVLGNAANDKLIGASVAGGGRLTAGNTDGSAGSGNPTYDLYLHNLSGVMTVNAQIVNNGANAVSLITSTGSQNGPVIRLANTNTYTGSTILNSTDVRLASTVGTTLAGSTSISIVGGNETTGNGGATSSRQAMSRIFFENTGSQLNSGATVSIINNATLDTNNFDQTLAGLVFNNTGGHTANSGGVGGSVRTGTGTLTLTGNITATNLTNISTIPFIAGNLDLNGGQRTITVDAITGAGVQGAAQIGLSSFADMTNGGIDKEGVGVFAITGVNTYTGATNVNAGTLVLAGRDQASPGVALTANIGGSQVTVAAAATVDMRGGNAFIGSLNGAGTVTNSVYATTSSATGMAGTLTIGLDNTSTGNFSGRFTNFINNINETTGYGLNVTKLGTGTQIVSGDNAVSLSPAYSNGDINNVGTLDIQQGEILVNGAAGSLGFTAINLKAGGTLTLDNSAVNKANRLGGFRLTDSANGDTANDTTTGRTISMQGGTIAFKEGATLVNEGDFNALSMATNPGVGSVTLTSGSSNWVFDTTGGSAGATVEANAFTAGLGSLHLNAGTTQTLGRAAAGASSITVYVAGGMASQGTGSLSAPGAAVLAFAGVQGNIVGGIRSDMIGTDSTGTAFLTYDRFGYRLLESDEYSAFPAQPNRPTHNGTAATPTNPPASWAAVSPTINAAYTGNALVNTAQTWTTNTTILSLTLGSGGGLTSAGGSIPLVNSPTQLFNALGTLNTLTVTTGGIIANMGNLGLTGGAVSAGGNALRIYAVGDIDVRSNLISTSVSTGLIKEGAGILNLTKSAYFGNATDVGQTVVNAGTLLLNSGAANTLTVLNTAAGSVTNSADSLTINSGATVNMMGFDQVVLSLTSADTSPGGGGTLTNTGALANFYANASAGFGGSITGAINLYKTGTGTLTLTSPSTYTGATTVQGGILTMQDSATLASTTYNLNGGQLRSENRSTSLSGIANRAPSSATWNMRSGTYLELGRPGEHIFETVATVNAIEGYNIIQVDAAVGSATALNIDTFNLTAGAQVNFTTGAGTLGATGANPSIYFDTAPTTIGGVIPWAIGSGTQIAMYNSTINPLTGGHYGVAVPNQTGGTFTTPNYQDTQITSATTGENVNQGTGAITESITVASRVFNSFRFASTTATTIALNAAGGVGSAAPSGEIVRLESGVFIADNTGNLVMSNGQLTAGQTVNAAATLYATVPGGTQTLNTQVVDNGTGILTFVKGGVGTLALNAQPSAGIALAATATGTLAGSTTLTLSAAPSATLVAGDRIIGPGIANGTTVVSIASNVITMSQPALASVASGTYGFGNAQALPATSVATGVVNPVIPMANTAGLYIGQSVSGTGITGTISAITANTNITVSGTTSAATGTTLGFNSAPILSNEAFSGSLIVNQGALNFSASAGSGRRLTNSTTTVQNPALVINNGGTVTLTPGGALAPTTDVAINGGGVLTFGVSGNAVTGLNALNSLTFNNNGGTVVPTVNIVAAGILTIKNGLVTSGSDNQGSTPLIQNGTLTFGQISLATATSATTVSVADVGGFIPGQTVTGFGISAGTTIDSITGNALTLTGGTATAGLTGALSTVNQAAGSIAAMSPTLNVTTNTPGKLTADLQITSVIANSTVGGAGVGGWSNLANGGGALTKTGNGNLSLGGASTFDNGFVLTAGTLTLNASTNVTTLTTGAATAFANGPVGTGALTISGGTITADTTARILNNNLIVTGDFTFGGQQAGHNVTINGATNLGTTGPRAITVTSPLVTATLAGVISGTGSGITKNGNGILVLGQNTTPVASTYTGANTINAGLVVAGNATALGANTNDLTVKSNATLNVSGQNLTVDGLNGDNATLGGLITNTGTTATLTIGNANEATANFAGAITNTGINDTTNALRVTKVGTGTQIFAGVNTYTGATAVNAGTLIVNGSISGSTTTVNGTGTLGGTGTTGAVVLNSGGAIAPGSGIGTLSSVAGATWNGETAGTFAQGKFELSTIDNTSDRLALAGTLTKGTGTTFKFDFGGGGYWDGVNDTTYTLATFSSTTFIASNFSFTNLQSGLDGTFQVTSTEVLFVIPEPNSLAMLAGSLGMALGLQRFRRRRSS
jgi:autotransporter-associated beta strand protein